MKNSIPLLGFFLLAITLTSCKSEQEKKAEIVTNNYVRFIDSIANKSAADALANWNSVEENYEKISTQLNIEIDNLEDNDAFDAKIDAATAKFEAYKNSVLQQKSKLSAGNHHVQ